jgi:hypothetical protein
MSMKNIVLAGAAATFMAGSALAADPVTLTDGQMDTVSAGFSLLIAGGLIGPTGAIGEGIAGTALTQFATSDQFVISPDGTALATLTTATARNDVQLRAVSSGIGAVGSLGNVAFAGFANFP